MNLARKFMAEFLGTFAIVFMGCGAIMVGDRFPGSVSATAIPLIFGLTVAAMIYALGHISGAHFNPAVTLAFAVGKHMPSKEIKIFWFAQFLGAVVASCLLGLILPDGQSFGAVHPEVPIVPALVWEAILSFFLMLVIVSVATDTRAVGAMAGSAIGAIVAICAYVGGPVTGAAMNPARALGPALFSGNFAVLWIYFVGPCIGTVAAALLYKSFGNDSAKGLL